MTPSTEFNTIWSALQTSGEAVRELLPTLESLLCSKGRPAVLADPLWEKILDHLAAYEEAAGRANAFVEAAQAGTFGIRLKDCAEAAPLLSPLVVESLTVTEDFELDEVFAEIVIGDLPRLDLGRLPDPSLPAELQDQLPADAHAFFDAFQAELVR